ncbi:TPA: winged helix-turn-helix domain-containing protein [Serratia fonticola]
MYKSKGNNPSKHNIFELIDNVFYYQKHHKLATLSKNQAKLLHCLLCGQGKKEQVIETIWGGGNTIQNESKYIQLILRTRSKLSQSGFPSDTILTIKKFGVCLNESPSPPADELNRNFIEPDIDSRVIHSFHM